MTYEIEDDILEHFGAKGMKWGIRKDRTASAKDAGKQKDSSKKTRAKQIAVVGGVVAAGAIIAYFGHQRLSSLKIPASIAPSPRQPYQSIFKPRPSGRQVPYDADAIRAAYRAKFGARAAQQTISKIGSHRFSAIPMPPVPVARPMPSVARSAVTGAAKRTAVSAIRLHGPAAIAKLRASMAQTTRKANADLRARDNEMNIPFPQRSYLKEWD